MKAYQIWTAHELTGDDFLPKDKAKSAIEEYCSKDLKMKGKDKDKMVKTIHADIDKQSGDIQPSTFVEYLK